MLQATRRVVSAECSTSSSSKLYARHASKCRGGVPSKVLQAGCRRRCSQLACSASEAGGQGDDASSSVPDTLPISAVDTDWREFRARLIASTRSAESSAVAGTSTVDADGAGSALESGANLWAHEVPGPEKGALLLAHPQMFRGSQTYFSLAAVLLLDHDASGSYGVILNRPTQYHMAQLQTDIPPLHAFPGNRLFLGGDVGETAMVVLTRQHNVEGAVEVMRGVYLCNIVAAEAAVKAGVAEPNDFRFYAKYAGWGAGQLASECKAGVWFCAAASAALALSDEAEHGRELWHQVLEQMGGDYSRVSTVVREVEQQGGIQRSASNLSTNRTDGAE